MAVSILFNMINVGGQQRNGSIAIGEVMQNGWAAHSKHNQGQAGLFGISSTVAFANYNIDNDLIDAPINASDITPSVQGQAV